MVALRERLLWFACGLSAALPLLEACSSDSASTPLLIPGDAALEAQDSTLSTGGNAGAGGSHLGGSGGVSDSSVADVLGEGGLPEATLTDSSLDATESGEGDAALMDGLADATQAPLRYYVAPTGKDTNDGSSEAKAVLTLTRVHDLLSQAKVNQEVEIRLAPGRYQAQRVTWTYTMPTHRIRFMPLLDDKNRPVFDGCLVESVSDPQTQCPGGTWLKLEHSKGEETNLHFEYIQVERYQTAISLNGDRNAEATSNGSNRIYGCYFHQIGNVFNPALDPSTAAVRLVNSDDNEIANNHFVEIVNTSQGGLLHAIYNAHMSDRNLIRGNRFEKNSGDPIRIRDYSNDNDIRDNRFRQVGTTAGYTDWYCDHEVETACTKPTPECPSWRNQFRNNELNGNWSCDPLAVWHLFQDDETTGCTKPPGAVRVSTSGNTQITPPCSN